MMSCAAYAQHLQERQHGRHASCHVICVGQVMCVALPAEQMCGARLTAHEAIPTHPQWQLNPLQNDVGTWMAKGRLGVFWTECFELWWGEEVEEGSVFTGWWAEWTCVLGAITVSANGTLKMNSHLLGFTLTATESIHLYVCLQSQMHRVLIQTKSISAM